MTMRSFSIRALLWAVATVAVAIVLLLNSSQVTVKLSYTTALVFLLIALVGTPYSRGSRRAFWVGFAIFGWTYFLLAGGGPFHSKTQYLTTSILLDYVYGSFFDDPEAGAPIVGGSELTPAERTIHPPEFNTCPKDGWISC